MRSFFGTFYIIYNLNISYNSMHNGNTKGKNVQECNMDWIQCCGWAGKTSYVAVAPEYE